ncbi:hypothetical protein ACIQ9Q_38980 [Streptomyces sp. NPDC094438]|uniref:hypothetical protein n=1 Tax=Streptomyces sp. NPDC094438 TaxID=3366061 RepID=UPI003827C3DF
MPTDLPFYCPAERRLNPEYLRARDTCLAWLRHHGCLDTPEESHPVQRYIKDALLTCWDGSIMWSAATARYKDRRKRKPPAPRFWSGRLGRVRDLRRP